MSEEDTPFPILSADGAYVHFLEGFASLVFFQLREIYNEKENGSEVKRKKEILADIRIPISLLRRLSAQIQDGLEMIPTFALMQTTGLDYYSNRNIPKNETEEYISESVSKLEIKIEDSNAGTYNLTDEGKEKLKQIILHLTQQYHDEVREVIQGYSKDKVKSKNE